MRTAAIVRCYHLTDYLVPVLKSLEDIDLVYLVNHRFAGVNIAKDDVLDILEDGSFPNVMARVGCGKYQHEVFNDALEVLSDFDLIFINDADEIIIPEERKIMIEEFQDNPKDALFCPVCDYADYENRYSQREHMPIVAVRPHVRFHVTRCANHENSMAFPSITMHHFGFCFKESDMQWKINNAWHSKKSADINCVTSREKEPVEIPVYIKELLQI